MTTPGGITSYTYPANSDRLGSLAGLLQQTDSYDASAICKPTARSPIPMTRVGAWLRRRLAA